MNRHRVRSRVVATAALATVVASTAAAVATPPGDNGQIAFRRYGDVKRTTGAVFTINTDGSGLRQITHPPKPTVDDQPDWSSDGKRLVFCRLDHRGSCAITVVNADGSGLRRVSRRCDASTLKCADRYQPSFTPDGRHIVYTRASGRLKHFKDDEIQHSAIGIMALDGSGEREIYRLPPYAADIEFAQMSPDGKRVVFERFNAPHVKNAFGRVW